MKVYFLGFCLIPILVACSGDASAGEPETSESITYYVLRHTERDAGVDEINEEGLARAESLADALGQAGVDEIATTSFNRGQQSGEPLSERTGAPITVAPVEPSTWPSFGAEIASWQLEREETGATYVFIGHSSGYNTALLKTLGAPDTDELLGEDYQDMVILVREPDGTVKLSALQYGGPSSLD